MVKYAENDTFYNDLLMPYSVQILFTGRHWALGTDCFSHDNQGSRPQLSLLMTHPLKYNK